MRGLIKSLCAAAFALLLFAGRPAGAVEIEYWQYTFKQRVDAIDTLIAEFQKANPGITVKHVTVPYDNFRTRIAAAIPAGEGPDVVQLFHDHGLLVYAWTVDRAATMQQMLAANVDGIISNRPDLVEYVANRSHEQQP